MGYTISPGTKGNIDLRINDKTITMDYETACKLGEALQRSAFKRIQEESEELIIPKNILALVNLGFIEKIVFEDISDNSCGSIDHEHSLYKVEAFVRESNRAIYGDRIPYALKVIAYKDREKMAKQLDIFKGIPISFVSGPLVGMSLFTTQ